MLIRTALAGSVLAVGTALSPAGCQPGTSTTHHTTTTTATSQAPKAAAHSDDTDDVEWEAECDMHNHAIHVKPNTAKTRKAAERFCQHIGTAIDNAPWPDSLHPVPLPTR